MIRKYINRSPKTRRMSVWQYVGLLAFVYYVVVHNATHKFVSRVRTWIKRTFRRKSQLEKDLDRMWRNYR